jgi:hypothetical protein
LIPNMKRHVALSEVSEKWSLQGVNAGLEPDKLFTWIEENLLGRWSHRRMALDEVRRITGMTPRGGFFFFVAFEDPSDALKFDLKISPPMGQA